MDWITTTTRSFYVNVRDGYIRKGSKAELREIRALAIVLSYQWYFAKSIINTVTRTTVEYYRNRSETETGSETVETETTDAGTKLMA